MVLYNDSLEVSNMGVLAGMITYLPNIIYHTEESKGQIYYVYSQ